MPMMLRCYVMTIALLLPLGGLMTQGAHAEMPWIGVSAEGPYFAEHRQTPEEGQRTADGDLFIPWGFNYDHDEKNRLLEDYWQDAWPKVVQDFKAMKDLGANVVRIHLQYPQFMEDPDSPNQQALDRLAKLVELAEETGLYLNLTGLGCYHKQDVPPWYDALEESARWQSQTVFWEAVTQVCRDSPAIFAYDLMNEPVVPGGDGKRDDWLGAGFGDKHFVQFIGLERKGRVRHEVAKKWIDQLVAAIRQHDTRHLITVGLVHWSLDRPGITSGFVPEKVHDNLDFVAVHIYPETGKVDEAIETLTGFAIGKPVLIQETFPLKSSAETLGQFLDRSQEHAAGWIGFYWGKSADEYRADRTLAGAIKASWLDLFEEKTGKLRPAAADEPGERPPVDSPEPSP